MCFSVSLSLVPVSTQKVASAPSLHNLVHYGNPVPSDPKASQLWPVPALSEWTPMVGTEAVSTLCPSGSQCGFFCRTVSGLMASPCTCVLVSGSRLWAWGSCESSSDLLGPGCGGCRWGWQLSPEASVPWSPGVAAFPRFLGQRPEAPRGDVAQAGHSAWAGTGV